MRRSARLGLASAVVLTACGLGLPPIQEGWNPDGPDRLVTYNQYRADAPPPIVGAQVGFANGEGWWSSGGLGTGCHNGITYPWSMSAGPTDGDRSRYEEVLNSGAITKGTTTVWMDVAPDGAVTVGWGVPEWAEVDAEATMCDSP